MYKLTQHEFLRRCAAAHGDRYELTSITYTGMHDKITVVCPSHGEFNPYAHHFMHGHGCKRCANTKTQEAFMADVGVAHGDKYILDAVTYLGAAEFVYPECREHGVFAIRARRFRVGKGCQICSAPKKKNGPEGPLDILKTD